MGLKAHPVGTAGLGDVDVLEKIYGTKSDAKANNNKFYCVELQQSKANPSAWAIYVDYGRIGGRSTKKEYLPASGAPLSEAEARAGYKAQVAKKFGRVKCSACGNGVDDVGKEKCSSCGRVLNYKDYPKNHYVPVQVAQAKVGSDEGQSQVDTAKLSKKAQSQVVVKDDKNKTAAKAPTYHPRIVGFIDHIYAEAGHAAQHSLNTGALKTSADNPLGTLSQSQLDSGKEVLMDVADLLNWRKGKLLNSTDRKLVDLTSRWYQTIPQNIGYRPDWDTLCLNDWMKHQAALDLLDLLSDVKGVQTSFKRGSTTHDRIQAMGCKLEVVKADSSEYKRIVSGIMRSKGRNHHFQTKVRGIFKIRVKPHQARGWFDPQGVGNHQMLYHGSRNANIMGICSKGLLMRPPGVVITGSMFGGGLYWADSSTKSLQYSRGGWGGTTNRQRNCYLFVVNVALGRVMEYYNAQPHLTRAPRGYHSVKGCKGRSLIHNEYITYELRQHQIEYVVDVDTH